jgi:hypothetical protein
VLVPAVLGPEQREDRKLEVVRTAAEQLVDAIELSVRETERAVERLLGDGAQGASVSRAPDGPTAGTGRKAPSFASHRNRLTAVSLLR